MNIKLYRLLPALLLSVLMQTAMAQDVHFSQFYENATMRNPALAGIFTGDYRVGFNYRSQWSNLAVPFETMMASAEAKLAIRKQAGDFVSVGLTAAYDKAGTINFNSLTTYVTANYNKCLNDQSNTYISAGFNFGYIQRSVNTAKMAFANQYVGGVYSSANASGENVVNTNVGHYDVGAGISINSSTPGGKTNYYAGAGVFHLNRGKEVFDNTGEFVRVPMRYTADVGFQTLLSDKTGLTVYANYQNQSPYSEFIFGGFLNYTVKNIYSGPRATFYAGCFYRWNDAVIPTVKMDYKYWGLTASYDVALTGNRIYMNAAGGFELTLSIRGNFKHDREYNVRCPRFEAVPGENYY